MDPMTSPKISICQAFQDECIFLTGATGYIGSLVLEQLLRTCPDVRTIYVLARGKNGKSAARRISDVMSKGLFHLVRDQPQLTSKVVVVDGDMTLPALGSASGDAGEAWMQAVQNTSVVIHCAAMIELEAHIKASLRHNYIGTMTLLELARRMPELQAFVYVSSAFANANQPQGSTVEEKIYPAYFGDAIAAHDFVATELMSLPDYDAEFRAKMYAKLWHFPNNYCLGKFFAEQLVMDAHMQPAPVAIVRPTFTAAVAGKPYPGYIGNYAGPTGASLAFALGMYGWKSAAWYAHHITDGIPGDMVSSTILAAAAATIVDYGGARKGAVGLADTTTAQARTQGDGAAAAGPGSGPEDTVGVSLTAASDAAAKAGAASVWAAPVRPAGVVGVASETTTPAGKAAGAPVPKAASTPKAGRAGNGFMSWNKPRNTPSGRPAASGPRSAAAAPAGPGPMSQDTPPARSGPATPSPSLEDSPTAASEPFVLFPPARADSSGSAGSSTGDNQRAATASQPSENLEGMVPESGGDTQSRPPLILHAATSTTYPLLNGDLFRKGRQFFSRHPPPFRLVGVFGYALEDPTYTPIRWLLPITQGITYCRVQLSAMFMKLVGQERAARRLLTGYKAWAISNRLDTDFNLYFSTHNTAALASRLVAEERSEFQLLWTPEVGNWDRFANSYMVAIHKLVFKQDLQTDLPHDFVYIPDATANKPEVEATDTPDASEVKAKEE